MPIKKIKTLKESDVSYITHGNIIKKHLYRDGLHLNRIGSTIIAENQSIKSEENSSEYQTENSDNLTKGLKILRLKYVQNL